MRAIKIPNVPDNLYLELEKLARVRGSSIADVAAEFLVRGLTSDDAHEARLLAELRSGREALSSRGVFASDEEIREAKKWGRE
jgi:hypothetical protein